MSDKHTLVAGNRDETSRMERLHADPRIETPDEFATERTVRYDYEPTTGSGEACFVVVQGGDLARRYRVGLETMDFGRAPSCAVHLVSPGVSRRHAQVEPSGDSYWLVDLESTNGTWLNGLRIFRQRLNHGDRVQLGDTVLRFLVSEELESVYHDEIYRLTTTDDATGLFNRRYFFQTLERELARAVRHERPLSLLCLHIDNFETLNEEIGYIVGDAVLVQAAGRMTDKIRSEDMIARLGGGEFCLLLPETGAEGAFVVAERLRKLMAARPFVYDHHELELTVTIGITGLHDVAPFIRVGADRRHNALEQIDRLIHLAGDKLDAARARGERNLTIR